MGNGILSEISQPFRPRARMLQLLGNELIGSARLAVFELVKNAYDAAAKEVVVCLDLVSHEDPTITVTDDGEGMTLDVLRSVWLVPGDDHRQLQVLVQTAKGIGDNGLWRIRKLNGILYLPDVGSKTTSFSSAFAGVFASN